MEPKIDAAALLDLATHSEPARVEEYTTRIKAFPVNINGLFGARRAAMSRRCRHPMSMRVYRRMPLLQSATL